MRPEACVCHDGDGSNDGGIASERRQKHQLLLAQILPVLALPR